MGMHLMENGIAPVMIGLGFFIGGMQGFLARHLARGTGKTAIGIKCPGRKHCRTQQNRLLAIGHHNVTAGDIGIKFDQHFGCGMAATQMNMGDVISGIIQRIDDMARAIGNRTGSCPVKFQEAFLALIKCQTGNHPKGLGIGKRGPVAMKIGKNMQARCKVSGVRHQRQKLFPGKLVGITAHAVGKRMHGDNMVKQRTGCRLSAFIEPKPRCNRPEIRTPDALDETRFL